MSARRKTLGLGGMQRINWIDWAKAIAICGVVFCHLPQSQEWYYYRFLQACIISVFFWISGYLKKDGGKLRENWKKYWNGLIFPYIIYNVVVYPYWLLRSYVINGGMPDWHHAFRPIYGVLLLEHENAFCEPLNGPLWYLPAILIIHIITDLCSKCHHRSIILTLICIASIFLYAANNHNLYMPNLTPIGILRGIPIYYMGYTMKNWQKFRFLNAKRDLTLSFILMIMAIVAFQWHMATFLSGDFIMHISLFFPINIFFVLSVIYGCKALNPWRIKVIINISVGTLVIIGLHFPLISFINYIFEKILGIEGVICYHWYSAIPISLLIVATLYPIIIFGKKHYPSLLGKKII